MRWDCAARESASLKFKVAVGIVYAPGGSGDTRECVYTYVIHAAFEGHWLLDWFFFARNYRAGFLFGGNEDFYWRLGMKHGIQSRVNFSIHRIWYIEGQIVRKCSGMQRAVYNFGIIHPT